VHNLALAEDVVQDAFCRALEVWKFRGVPENPSARLLATAKNRALDVLRRQRTAHTFAPELGRLLDSEWTSTRRCPSAATSKAFSDPRNATLVARLYQRERKDFTLSEAVAIKRALEPLEKAAAKEPPPGAMSLW
jgi:DNA-directed RNA polymerase specialized sigma24 family protein